MPVRRRTSRTRSTTAAPRAAWGAIALALVATACQRARVEAPVSPALPGVLVDAAWLVASGADAGAIVLDVRARDTYDLGHVPGAVSLPVACFDDPGGGEGSDLAPLAEVERVLGAAGVVREAAVVVCGSADYRDAARAFWVLEVHGVERVGVLEGGVDAWVAAGGELSRDAVARAPVRFVARLEPRRIATKLAVLRAIDAPGVTILDARSADEFAGRVAKFERNGHIPSAVNVDHGQPAEPEGHGICGVASLAELAAMHAAVEPGDRVITYCNTGTRASVAYLALRALGRDVAVYDGSWSEWSRSPELPVEVGDARREGPAR